MRGLWLLAVAGSLLGPATAEAKDCDFNLEVEEAKVRQASNCGRAHAIYTACLWGSTADLERGGMVQEKCEAEFLAKLKPGQMKAYRRRLAACDKKYTAESGTMYRAMEAVCHADAAKDFARKNSSAK